VTAVAELASVWETVVGQPTAVAALQRSAAAPVHAYLLVGPPGSTKHEAARAFAAVLLAGADEPAGRDARLAMAGTHPDVREVERVGPFITAEQAREIARLAALAPVEGTRKVMVLHEFHLLRPEGAALLLKTIEEPPASTIFLVLADFVPPDLVTIASRCVRVEFRAIPPDVLAAQLVAEGAEPAEAASVATAAGGDLTRARVLAADPDLAARRWAFAEVPRRLDGTGATVVRLAEELLARIDEAAAPLAERHAGEVAELEARIQLLGERGSGRKLLEDRHKRELRRHRVDELRAGLAVLAGSYRDALAAGGPRPESLIGAVERIYKAIDAFEHNPNEALLLQSLLWSLPAEPDVTR
jgi:DNA polymerase III subunit delta'